MQLTLTTDYAIRATAILALENRMMTTIEISNQMKIPVNYLKKLMRQLRGKGIVDVERGRYGGFYLAKKPETISLYDIITTIEPTMKINRCMEKDCYCNMNNIKECPVRQVHVRAQEALEKELKGCSIGDVVNEMKHRPMY